MTAAFEYNPFSHTKTHDARLQSRNDSQWSDESTLNVAKVQIRKRSGLEVKDVKDVKDLLVRFWRWRKRASSIPHLRDADAGRGCGEESGLRHATYVPLPARG